MKAAVNSGGLARSIGRISACLLYTSAEVYWETERWHFCFEFENQRYREETIRFYQRSLEHIVMTFTQEDTVWTELDAVSYTHLRNRKVNDNLIIDPF